MTFGTALHTSKTYTPGSDENGAPARPEKREAPQHRATKPANTDERWLVAKAKSGSATAFGELYDRHRVRIYHMAFRILRNRQDAEDAVQRSFQRAFTNLRRFREDATFSTWVTRIAINDALMLLRQRRVSTTLENKDDFEGPSVPEPADRGPTPEQALAETERRAAVRQAISHLRETLRSVVLLRELQGLTSAEAARQLGLTVAAVKARMFHARRQLRRHLERRLHARFKRFLIGTGTQKSVRS